MTTAHNWGETIDFITVKHCIQKDLCELSNLINELNTAGYTFLGYNSNGIVVDYKSLTPAPIKDDYLYNAINSLKDLIDNHILSTSSLANSVTCLKRDVDSQHNTIQSYDTKGKEVTGEFFILFDFLPEEIKKQLKIYIKT
jgi:hypothetical protein